MAIAPIGRNGVAPLHGARDRVGPHHLPVARDPGDRQADRLAGTGLDDHAADRYVRLEGGRDGDAAVGVGGDDRACVLVLCVIASLAESFRVEFSAAGPVQRLQRHVPPPAPSGPSRMTPTAMWLSVAPFWAVHGGAVGRLSPANSVTLSGPSSSHIT